LLIENNMCFKYTKSANIGLRQSTAEFVILLNSDTVVSDKWLEKMLTPLFSGDMIGLDSPLSNAATWQSIPKVKDEQGGYIINSLPKPITINGINDILCEISTKQYPIVPFLNGFCLGIKRKVIEQVGLFDEKAFPNGYGEEIDYCLRASEKGFYNLIVDDLYIYHAKSKSYGVDLRNKYAKESKKTLEKIYGSKTIANYYLTLENHEYLADVRKKFSKMVV